MYVAGYLLAVLVLGAPFLWTWWLLPSLLAQPFLRFYLLPEHTGCKAEPHVTKNTRSTTTSMWYSLLAWNMPYHAEHHAFPFIPFWQLPELSKALGWKGEKEQGAGGCSPSGAAGYVGFHRAFVKGLRLTS